MLHIGSGFKAHSLSSSGAYHQIIISRWSCIGLINMRLHKCVHKWGYWVCFGFCVPIGACSCVYWAGRYSITHTHTHTHLSHRGEDTPARSDTTGLPVGLYPAHLSVPELIVPVALAPIQPPPPASLFHTLDVATTPRQALSPPVATQTRWQLCPSARLCSSWVHHNEKKQTV